MWLSEYEECILIVVSVGALVTLVWLTLFFVFIFLRELKQAFSGYGVPFVETPDRKILPLLADLRMEPGQAFVDLGCGDGKVLEAVVRAFPGVRAVGYELSCHPYSLALAKKQNNGLAYEVFKSDFFKADLSWADVVYVYALPYLMGRIWSKISAECKPGTLLYANSFAVPGVEPIRTIPVTDQSGINVYRVGN